MSRIVYDGGELVYIPESMGKAKNEQLKGTTGEILCELACRICYDSLGTGRSSEDLHKHILDVQNHSVYEHYCYTVQFNCGRDNELSLYRAIANRKGMYIRNVDRGIIQITTNLRAILEWHKNPELVNNNEIRQSLAYYGHELCPQIIPRAVDIPVPWGVQLITDISELCEDQIWVSMYLSGSRGLTHEQVRHRFAMSQRSTRYVDESTSDFIIHPLVVKYLDDVEVSKGNREYVDTIVNRAALTDKLAYDGIVGLLQEYLVKQGVDKHTARKQARGAARLHLPNGLFSEMIYSAPISGWKWMLSQRYNDLADAEIRLLYAEVYADLLASRYGKWFEGLEITDAKDGIGTVINYS